MKRRRLNSGTPLVVQKSQTRPIDKDLISVSKSPLSTTQLSTVLKTATYPCTITGLRWDLDAVAITTAVDFVTWAIVVVHDGDSANTMSATDGASFYQPEQDVLAFGELLVSGNAQGNPINGAHGNTKTMRKLKAGDQLVFIAVGTVVSGASLGGIIQFFCKS